MKRIRIFILGMAILIMTAVASADTTIADIMPVLKKAKVEVSRALTALDKDLTAAAKKLAAIDLKSDEARKILSGLCKDRTYVFDCAIVDPSGKLSVIEPESARSYEGTDISSEAPVKDAFNTKKPVIGKVFKYSDGVNRVDFEYPIINDKGELLGSLSLLVNHEEFLKGIITPITESKPCKAWAMQPDGVILYDQDPSQVNKNIFTDPMFSLFEDLISFCKTVAKSPSGAGDYDFYKKGYEDKTIVKKDAAWDTVSLHGNQWRIVVMELEEDQPAPEAVKQK